jgi:hypothetical protein
MKLSFVPLLVAGKSVSLEARQALRENRLWDAAELIMQEYGLNCVEVGHLLNLSMCR